MSEDPKQDRNDDKTEDESPDIEVVDTEKMVDNTVKGGQLVRQGADLPGEMLVIPLNQRPVFPTMMLPLQVPQGKIADAIRFATEHDNGFVVFLLTREPLEDLGDFALEDCHRVGTVGRILKAEGTDRGIQVFCQILDRYVIDAEVSNEPYVRVRGHAVHPPVDTDDTQVRALAMAIVTALKDLVQYNPVFADEIKLVLANYNNIDGPGRLADLAVSLTTAKREEIQEVLETFDVIPRMEKVLPLLQREGEVAQLKTKIQSQIEEKVSHQQRKFFLNEQLKAIKEELGIETDEKSLEIDRFRKLLDEKRAGMSEEVVEACEEEIRKLGMLDPAASEYGVARNRLEWLTALPWGAYTTDQLDIAALRDGLDRDHYGLQHVKDRIVEFCAVRRLKQDRGGGIVCLVGPPGTGKTSIGMSIARQMDRTFYRFSLGGLRDESEIKGHRRTYVGALPGKLIQALRRCQSMNPVILLDEIDKMSVGMQGDPASALLEVLDPEQNSDFLDHYVDVRVDLSQVLFICTANDLAGIPEPLRDRVEIIRMAGYIESEKLQIGTGFLLPKQRAAHGLTAKDIDVRRSALRHLIRGYAREAGVRQAEQLIGKICRKVATARAERLSAEGESAKLGKTVIKPDTLEDYLGKPYISDDELLGEPVPGVITGLAWTAMGGATMEVEVVAVPAEEGGFTLTGQLGDVMKESATLAISYLHAEGERFGIDPTWFDRHRLHIHVPAGGTPKEGPSAGITIAAATLSLIRGQVARRKIGMTGELTLTGRVYPIGGVREKIVAARRSGLKRVILPRGNQRDWAELPEHLTDKLQTHFVSSFPEVLDIIGLGTPRGGGHRRPEKQQES